MERARHEESEAGEFSHKIPSILMDIFSFSLGFKEKKLLPLQSGHISLAISIRMGGSQSIKVRGSFRNPTRTEILSTVWLAASHLISSQIFPVMSTFSLQESAHFIVEGKKIFPYVIYMPLAFLASEYL